MNERFKDSRTADVRNLPTFMHPAASVKVGSQLPLAASCTNDRFAKVSVVTF
jgi:hypothetical protein